MEDELKKPTCRNCMHWSFDLRTSHSGHCKKTIATQGKPQDNFTLAFSQDACKGGSALRTMHTFSCNQHEMKQSKVAETA